jgi:agmatine deiminase
VACFTRPGQVLHLACRDNTDPNHAAFAVNLALLGEATDAKGRKLDVVTVEQPAGRREKDGVRLTLSYLNFLIGNGFVLMPAFGVPEDAPARGLLAELFPEHKVIQLPAMGIVNGGGGIHCITQQQPAVAG